MVTNTYLGTGEIEIAPKLSVYLCWSKRMSDAMDRRYWAVKHEWSEENERLRKQYEIWYKSRNAVQKQIKQMFAVTASLPVAGDHFMPGGEAHQFCETLRIEKRTMFSDLDSDDVLFVYEVCGEDIEELEEYREGDLDENEDE